MSTRSTAPHNIVLEFVRGTRPTRDLALAGVVVRLSSKGAEIENPEGLDVEASPYDVAAGMLCYRGDQPALQEWAKVVLTGSGFLDLRAHFEQSKLAEQLLEAVWDAAFGSDVDWAAALAVEREALEGSGAP